MEALTVETAQEYNARLALYYNTHDDYGVSIIDCIEVTTVDNSDEDDIDLVEYM